MKKRAPAFFTNIAQHMAMVKVVKAYKHAQRDDSEAGASPLLSPLQLEQASKSLRLLTDENVLVEIV